MTGLRDIDVIVFDVLGTLVDEPRGLRAGIREAAPGAEAPEVEELPTPDCGWHLALSSESAGAYKPAPEVYRLAVDAAGCPPDRVLMVAAHAWDLRGAQACGMRTAYVHRPVGDPPTTADAFDARFDGLDGLVGALARTLGGL